MNSLMYDATADLLDIDTIIMMHRCYYQESLHMHLHNNLVTREMLSALMDMCARSVAGDAFCRQMLTLNLRNAASSELVQRWAS